MNIANVILAHSHPEQLERLLMSMRNSNQKAYVHLDLKCDKHDFGFLYNMENVEPIIKRFNVKWGGFSMIRAIIESFRQVISSSQSFDSLNLLSGQDYPIKPLKDFENFLNQHPKKAFIEYRSGNHEWIDEAKHRIRTYHLTDYKFKGSTLLERVMNFILPYKKLPENFEIIGHSGWFTLDYESVVYLLDFFEENPSFINKFKFSWGSDEFLIQSILYNSPLRHKIVNNNLRYIDWSEGKASPKILTIEDKEKLKAATCFFARKFDADKDTEILDYIDHYILN